MWTGIAHTPELFPRGSGRPAGWVLPLLLCLLWVRPGFATTEILSQDDSHIRFRVQFEHPVLQRTEQGLLLQDRESLYLRRAQGASLVHILSLGIPPGQEVFLREISRVEEQADWPAPAPPAEEVNLPDPGVLGAHLAEAGRMRSQEIQRLRIVHADWRKDRWRLLREAVYELRFRPLPGAAATTRRPVVEAEAFDSVFERELLNADYSRRWRGREDAARPLRSAHPAFSGESVYKIITVEEGLYKVSTSWLSARGVPVDEIQSSRLALWLGDTQVPLLVVDGGDGSLDPGDYFVFEGRKRPGENFPTNFFGPQQAYLLSWEEGSGQRYRLNPLDPQGFEAHDRFVHHEHLEQSRVWGLLETLTAPPEEVDHWFWRELSAIAAPTSFEMRLDLPDLAPDTTLARIRYFLRGRSFEIAGQADHHVVMSVNGVWAGDMAFRQQEGRLSSWFPLPSEELLEERNTLRFHLPMDHGNEQDLSYLDYMQVRYPRRTVLRDGQLAVAIDTVAFENPQAVRSLEVDNVDGDLLVLSDTGEQMTTIRLGQQARSRLVAVPPGASRVRVAEIDRLPAPGGLVVSDNENLREGAQADMLILAPRNFLPDLEELRAYHGQSMSTRLLDIESVYNEFSEGNMDTEAIHRLLDHAFRHWPAPLPSYLLLVGKSSNYNRLQDTYALYPTLVPTDWVQTSPHGATPSDEEFAYVVGRDSTGQEDVFQDMMVGRFSVATVAQLRDVLAKHRSYREREDLGRWMETSIFAADNIDIEFEAGNDYIASHVLPKAHREQTIHVRSNSDYHGGAVEFIDLFNDGAVVNSYNGHGNVGIYATEALFRATDIRFLNNGNRLPICYAWSCLVGYFDNPDSMSMAELLCRQPDAGAIAFYGAAAKAYISVDNPYVVNYFANFYDDRELTFGQSILLTETTMQTISLGANVARMYNLLGDPALKPAFPGQDLLPQADYVVTHGDSTFSVPVVSDPPGLSGTLRAELWLHGNRSLSGISPVRTVEVPFNGGSGNVEITVPALDPDSSYAARLRLSMNTDNDRAIGYLPVYINSGQAGISWHTPELGIAGQPAEIGLRLEDAADSVYVRTNLGVQALPVRMPETGEGEYLYSIEALPENVAFLQSPTLRGTFRMASLIYDFYIYRDGVPEEMPGRIMRISALETLSSIDSLLQVEGNADSLWLEQDIAVHTFLDPTYGQYSLRDGATVILQDTVALSRGTNLLQSSLELSPGRHDLTLVMNSVWNDEFSFDWLDPLRVEDSFFLLTPSAGSGGLPISLGGGWSLDAGAGVLGQALLLDESFAEQPLSQLDDLLPGLGAPLLPEEPPLPLWIAPRDMDDAPLEGVTLGLELDAALLFQGADSTLRADEGRVRLARHNGERGLWLVQGPEAQGPFTGLLEAYLHGQEGIYLPLLVEDSEGPSISVDVEGQWFAAGDLVSQAPVFQILLSDPAGIDLGDGSSGPQIELDGTRVDETEIQVIDALSSARLSWTPGTLEPGSEHTLRVIARDAAGNESSEELSFRASSGLALSFLANHPNPFDDQTTLAWELTGTPSRIGMAIYTSAGRKVRTIRIPFPRIGYDEFIWDGRDDKGRDVANGVYYLKMTVSGKSGSVEKIVKLARLR